ncbi:MAG: nitric oxide synthase oxygenase [Saprospiraceae bacterium]
MAGKTGPFSLLPVILKDKEGVERVFLFKGRHPGVKLKHPRIMIGLKKLNLKWFALPVISDMILEIGGIYTLPHPLMAGTCDGD